MGDSQYSFSLTTFRYVLPCASLARRSGVIWCGFGFVICGFCGDFVCSPSGKLVQIEHALTAVGSGQTSLGIKGASREAIPSLYFYCVMRIEKGRGGLRFWLVRFT